MTPLVRLRSLSKRPLRVLLAQLPIPELVFRRVRANEPIAAGYLKAAAESWAAANGRASELEVEILDRSAVDRLGDAALARAIASRRPDVLGLSLFLWNSSRSLHVAAEVKKLLPDVVVIVGGPEVTKDNPWVVETPAVDLGAIGEGEGTFQDVVAWLLGEGPADPSKIAGVVVPVASRSLPVLGATSARALLHGPARPSIDLARVPSPWLSGAVPVGWERSIGLETLRGCPFKCSFCYYYKQFARTSQFPGRWLEDHFAWAKDHGVSEVVFLDPTLNARPAFAGFLDRVIAANPSREIELHAELVAEMVDEKIADKLAAAGVKGVECGLQSANEQALEAVNRRNELDKFVRAVRLMSERGIVVKTDLIIGLPLDDEESIERSMRWVEENGLDDDIQVFHLQLLPGTELREKEAEHGYARLARPPYYMTRSRWLDEAAIRRLAARAEETFGVEFDPPARPLLGDALAPDADADDAYWTHVRLDALSVESARALGQRLAPRAANALTVEVGGDAAPARAFLAEVARANPHGSVDIIIDVSPATTIDDLAALKDAAARPEPYLNSWYRFVAPEGSCPAVRVTARTSDARAAASLADAVPVVQRIDRLDDLARAEASAFVELAAAPGALAALEARFGDDREAAYVTGDVALARAWSATTPESAPPIRRARVAEPAWTS